jgi:hypothetical protein
MSEMIEHVAKAILEADREWARRAAPDLKVPVQWSPKVLARAAIVAMREPTNEMLDAGAFYFLSDGDAGPTLEAERNLARSAVSRSAADRSPRLTARDATPAPHGGAPCHAVAEQPADDADPRSGRHAVGLAKRRIAVNWSLT